MGLWKIKWLKDQVLSRSIYRRNAEILKHPLIFNTSLLLKVVPGLYKRPIRYTLKNGGWFTVPDFLSAYIYWEIFLFHIYDLPDFGKKDPTIIDIGANIGIATMRFKLKYPDSEVYCYEPYGPHFELLKQNILNSKFSNVFPFQLGIGGNKRHTKFYLHAKNSGAHSIYPEELTYKTVEIDLIDLHEAIDNTRSGYCDLLKLDCEGAEYEIIKSMDRELAAKIRNIVYEATVDRYDPKELNSHLEQIGYKVEQVNGYIYKAALA